MKSADVLSYLEKAFNVNPSPSGNPSDAANMIHQQSPNLVAKSTSVPAASDMAISDATANVNISENSLSRTLSEETIDYENLLSTLDIGVDNLSRTGSLSTSSNLSRSALDRSASSPISDLRLLQLYKVRFLLLTRNLKSIKREVKEAMNLARGGDSTVALLLKSQFEYARGNFKKAIKLLVASNCRTEAALSSLCNNNFGCIYFQAGKFHTAAMFFSRALSNCSALRKDKPKKLSALSLDKSLKILYNCGLQYLACGKPLLAAHCFQKASLVFSKQPLLWLRISECCLLALEKGLLQSNGSSSECSEVEVRVIGKGKWQHLMVEDGAVKSGHQSSIGNGKMVEDKPVELSVTLARQCLLNALQLLNSSLRATESSLPSQMNLEGGKSNDILAAGDVKLSNGDVKESKAGQGHNDTLKISLLEFEQVRARENQLIKQTLFGDLAYVELELGNPVKALSAAKSLLEIPNCAKIYVFLGHVYAAEALCLLGRPKEAAEHMLKYMNEESGFVLPYGEEDCEPWKIKRDLDDEESNSNTQTTRTSVDSRKFTFPSPDEARGILFLNFASLCAKQGDLEQAHQFATQSLSAIPNNTKAILALVYVNLMLGKTHEALVTLKQCNRVRFLPGR
uniref:CCR4-NOT transcription complex subunit 10 n=1 Tax=Kalanchoe fedtschenkoi TaxID=63787 RepID=A0A7N1A7J1_KALFE